MQAYIRYIAKLKYGDQVLKQIICLVKVIIKSFFSNECNFFRKSQKVRGSEGQRAGKPESWKARGPEVSGDGCLIFIQK